MVDFNELGLQPNILRAIEERGYKTPTPIQEQAIPQVLMGRDVLGCAQTGTGKTAGFCLPMLEILSSGRAKARMPRSLILEPTRELAAQVDESFTIYGKYVGLTTALLTGGHGADEQIAKLDRGVDVLIATPGRMLDLFERGKIMLADIKIFVIDEADRMLDMGFIPDIEKIASKLPRLRQTLFFSATMPPEIKKLASKFLMNPKEISVSPPATTAATVEQAMVRLTTMQKRHALRALLRKHDFKSVFVFSNRKRDISTLVESLSRHDFKVVGLHGDMPQSKREEALEKFKSGEAAVMVCSDVAARGLDIKGADAVFNFDVPFNAEDYVHRIGRTGRAGSTGHSFTFVTPDDDKLLDNIKSLIKKDITEIKVEGMEEHTRAPREEDGDRPRRSRDGGQRRGGQGRDRTARSERPERAERSERPERTERSERQSRPMQDSGVQSYKDNGGSGVVGFGDDLPAFLRTSARPESTQEDKPL
jgi:superfamily II DNA/RNA helicase